MAHEVILCDEDGNELGTMDKAKAHAGEGTLHKAYSIFIFRKNGEELFIQKRSHKKPLWPLHWSNSCCSHPIPGSDLMKDAEERLEEECGFTCELRKVGSFVYRAKEPQGRGSEFEHDTVLVGVVSDRIQAETNPDEVSDSQWINVQELMKLMKEKPLDFTPWFFFGLKIVLDQIPQ